MTSESEVNRDGTMSTSTNTFTVTFPPITRYNADGTVEQIEQTPWNGVPTPAALYEIGLMDHIIVPTGFRLLVHLPEKGSKTQGGIYMPEQSEDREHAGSMFGHVVAMGPDAYKDEKRFLNGPWCQVGDWIMFKRYAGTRFKVDGAEWRLINDDSVEAVITDPSRVESL